MITANFCQKIILCTFICFSLVACKKAETSATATSKGAGSKNNVLGYAGKDLFEPPVGLITPMGKNSNPVFNEGTKHYANKDYDQAIQVWQGIRDNSGRNDTLTFYLAAAHFAKKEYGKAVPYLLKTRAVHDSKFSDMTHWFLGVCHYKLESYELARQFLEHTETPLKARLLNEMQ